jgi:hypothetical protein
MIGKIIKTIALAPSLLAFALSPSWTVRTQDREASYSKMAPVERYLMSDQSAEITIARTAVEESVERSNQ